MPTPPSPARLRILELLADGNWHPVATVLDQAALVVPPGRAWRQNEHDRLRTGPPARTRGSDDAAIRSGARDIAVRTLRTMVGRPDRTSPKLIERDGDRIRLTAAGADTIGAPRPQETQT